MGRSPRSRADRKGTSAYCTLRTDNIFVVCCCCVGSDRVAGFLAGVSVLAGRLLRRPCSSTISTTVAQDVFCKFARIEQENPECCIHGFDRDTCNSLESFSQTNAYAYVREVQALDLVRDDGGPLQWPPYIPPAVRNGIIFSVRSTQYAVSC